MPASPKRFHLPFLNIAAILLLAVAPVTAQTQSPQAGKPAAKPAAPTVSKPVSVSADRLKVDASIQLGAETLGTPSLIAKPGEEFGVKIGQEGKQRISLSGMTAPINDRNVALDYTLELEQWGKEGSRLWRTTQSVRIAYGERYIVAGIKDAEGRELRMEIAVSRDVLP